MKTEINTCKVIFPIQYLMTSSLECYQLGVTYLVPNVGLKD